MRRPPWRFLASRWPWLAALYLVLSAGIAIVAVVLLVLTFLLLPLWGLAVGGVERRRTRLLGFPRQRSGHLTVADDERHHWLNLRLTESATWREVLALLVDLAFGGIAAVVLLFDVVAMLVLVMVAHAGITGPTRMRLIGDPELVITPANWWPVLPLGLMLLCGRAICTLRWPSPRLPCCGCSAVPASASSTRTSSASCVPGAPWWSPSRWSAAGSSGTCTTASSRS